MVNSDDFIQADVYYLLSCNLSLPRHGIIVCVESGLVTLLGCVDWPFQKTAAEWGILEHSGAVGIVNQIEVKSHCEVDTQWTRRFRHEHA